MRPLHPLVAASLLLLATPLAYGQDTRQRHGPEAVTAASRVAIPRADAPSRPAGAAGPIVVSRTAAAAPAADDQRRRGGGSNGRQAEPRGSRPRGDQPPTGVAVPRQSVPLSTPVIQSGRTYRPAPRVYAAPRAYAAPRVYTAPRYYAPRYYAPRYYAPRYYNYYPSPRHYYPYGYGAFGLGYFYYNPWGWYPGSYGVGVTYGSGNYAVGGYYNGGSYPGGYYGGAYGRAYGPTGELRLRVEPKQAEVFVDGYYAGLVDDFDGTFQGLRLEDGPYHVSIRAPGYEPLEFDVRIIPGQDINYRGVLRPLPVP
jgi:hypothetical protein